MARLGARCECSMGVAVGENGMATLHISVRLGLWLWISPGVIGD